MSYLELAKPRIIMGNLITAAGGFFLASSGPISWILLAETLIGLALVIGSAGVLNNAIDRHHDEKMVRTRNRPLVRGTISLRAALIFGSILGLLGFATLPAPLPLLVAAAGFVTYVGIYSQLKYHTSYATHLGSLAGAAPPVVGYCAASGAVDLGALLLFAIVALWQMPHFFAIAIYRSREYAAASIPVLPLVRGVPATQRQMVIYMVAFLLALLPLTLLHYASVRFLALSTLAGGAWLIMAIKGLRGADPIPWARSMFRISLIVILLISAVMALG